MPPTLISTSLSPTRAYSRRSTSRRPPRHRWAGDTAGPELGDARGGQAVAGHRGIGRDDAGQAQFDCQIGDLVDVGVGQVRRDLDQHRRRRLRPHRRQDRPQRLDGLQIAQARRVR